MANHVEHRVPQPHIMHPLDLQGNNAMAVCWGGRGEATAATLTAANAMGRRSGTSVGAPRDAGLLPAHCCGLCVGLGGLIQGMAVWQRPPCRRRPPFRRSAEIRGRYGALCCLQPLRAQTPTGRPRAPAGAAPKFSISQRPPSTGNSLFKNKTRVVLTP